MHYPTDWVQFWWQIQWKCTALAAHFRYSELPLSVAARKCHWRQDTALLSMQLPCHGWQRWRHQGLDSHGWCGTEAQSAQQCFCGHTVSGMYYSNWRGAGLHFPMIPDTCFISQYQYQHTAVCHSVLHAPVVSHFVLHPLAVCHSVLHAPAVCHSVLHAPAVCHSVLHAIAACRSVLFCGINAAEVSLAYLCVLLINKSLRRILRKG